MSRAGNNVLPRIALTLGDVAGIGPEVIARALCDPELWTWCQPVVVGHPAILQRAFTRLREKYSSEPCFSRLECVEVPGPGAPVAEGTIPCWNPAGEAVLEVPLGQLDARAGRAAYDYLVAATRAALRGEIQAITTAPLNKAALHLADLDYPGHTEILAEECSIREFGMMLYLPASQRVWGQYGLGVVHVTLHTSVRSVPDIITREGVAEKIELMHRFLRRIGCAEPRVAVSALNPHGGEGGLFGDEESRVISPGVELAASRGFDATGPLPADTLLKRAVAGEFDGVVAMYHDQGHIALKLIGFDSAVNITLGLPIVRTSPSHGTGFDIVHGLQADATGFVEAVRLAALLSGSDR